MADCLFTEGATALLRAVAATTSGFSVLAADEQNPISTESSSASLLLLPEVANVVTTITWLSLIVAILSLLFGVLKLVRKRQNGESWDFGQIGWPLLTLSVLGSVGALAGWIVGLLANTEPSRASSAIVLIQGSLAPLIPIIIVISIIVTLVQTSLTGEGKRIEEALRNVGFVIVVWVFAAIFAAALLEITQFLSQLMVDSVRASIASQLNLEGRMNQDSDYPTSYFEAEGEEALSILGLLVICIIAILMLFVAIIFGLLMFVRGIIILVLLGWLPIAASLRNFSFTSNWFSGSLGYLVGFIVFEPIALSIILATVAGTAAISLSAISATPSIILAIKLLTGVLLAIFVLPSILQLIGSSSSAYNPAGATRTASRGVSKIAAKFTRAGA
jgi:hypothetical protein